jgi:ATP-dependent helicase/nuclease subunit A
MKNDSILSGLDEDQIAAVKAEVNTAVTAGAGSGKTLVLSSRYAWLIMEKGLKTDEILSLTFTNKAANEMYNRIYRALLGHKENLNAREALDNFHKAGISTLDSFCSSVAHTAAGRYGISPDFSIDNESVRELAIDAALPFVLGHRTNPSLKMLMAENKTRSVAKDLFAEFAVKHTSVSRSMDFGKYFQIQTEYMLDRWNEKSRLAGSSIKTMIEGLASVTRFETETAKNFRDVFKDPAPPEPDMQRLLGIYNSPENENLLSGTCGEIQKQAAAYFRYLKSVADVRTIMAGSKDLSALKEPHDLLKKSLYDELESIASCLLQADITAGVFKLLEQFQELFRRKKREAGVLSFNDVACLAVDALAEHEDLRRVYEENIKAVMVDEFQDNNRLQKDLVFLIAGKSGKTAGKAGPGIGDIHQDRLFFVGDEKQSIYRFRGADVSVFRNLAEELAAVSPGSSINLSHNYRSSPMLVAAFNWIFGGLLPEEDSPEISGAGVFQGRNTEAAYEASYTRVYSRQELSGEDKKNPAVHFCFLETDETSGEDPYKLSTADLEAAFIARKIRSMVEDGVIIKTRDGEETCDYRHFAVLQRTTNSQGALEKQFRAFGIPYSSDDPAGLFSDAPINDLYSFLRLMVYPEDRGAYGAVLRSPLTGLNDRVFAACLLAEHHLPFGELPPDCLSPGEAEQYKKAQNLYRSMLKAAETMPVTSLLFKLWYEWGYRYETVWSSLSQIYGELFDFFFELARKSDERGRSLSGFLDVFDSIITNEERIKDLAVPMERRAGVRIMTIHKSKGLEFPVVFVWRAGRQKTSRAGEKLIYVNEKWGPSVFLPALEELPGGGRGNYFYDTQCKEDRAREEAELRRLLYVAMTRAEAMLFVTADLPKQNKDDPPAENLEERLGLLAEKNPTGKNLPSFLHLLLPSLTNSKKPPFLFTLESIPVLSRDELRQLYPKLGPGDVMDMYQAVEGAAPAYTAAAAAERGKPYPVSIAASSLGHGETAAQSGIIGEGRFTDEGNLADLDDLVENSGLSAGEFGTIVHAEIESRFAAKKVPIPDRLLLKINNKKRDAILEGARKMADGFFESKLGLLCKEASFYKSEFSVITAVNSQDNLPVPILGVIDLLFEKDGIIHVVDFKTDKTENPERHYGQLAAYYQAAEDIFGKPVKAFIYYLRSKREKEITDKVARLQLDKFFPPEEL